MFLLKYRRRIFEMFLYKIISVIFIVEHFYDHNDYQKISINLI